VTGENSLGSTPSRHPRVVVAIPCYNTERFIREVVARSLDYADEVIVVNDGSDDRSAAVAEQAGAKVVNHPSNEGYGQAIKSCFDAGRRSKADVLVTLDGDGQHDPSEIPVVLAAVLSGEADIAIGSRFRGKHCAMPAYRRFGVRVITFLFNVGSRVRLSDSQSGFRAYGGKALELLRVTEKGMGASVELIVQARNKGLRMVEIPISCSYEAPSARNPLAHGLGVALTVVKIRLKHRLNMR